MAVDLSIQVFSYELFNTIFIEHGIIPRVPLPKPLLDAVYCGYKGEKHVNNNIIHAVYCRQAIFHDVYRLQFEYTDIASCDSPSDFLAYMCSTFSSQEFRELKEFEHIFATLAFVVEMCLYCFYKRNAYFIKDAYLCWAMYFDTELKSDFYEQGGWTVLQSVARSYIPPFLVIKTCLNFEILYLYRSVLHTVPLQKLIAGMEDYYDFQNFSDAGENLTRAKPWTNFRLNNKTSQKSRRTRFDIKSIGGLEHFLRCVKFLSDPMGEMVLDFGATTQHEKIFSKNEYPVNVDLANITMQLSDCDINSYIKPVINYIDAPEANELPETIQCLTDAVHALTLEVQAIETERLLKKATPVSGENQEGNSGNSNIGILRIYDLLKISLDVDDVRTALSHAPVFLRDHYRNKQIIKAKVSVDKSSITGKTPPTVKKETCQLQKPINSQQIPNGTKTKKKKKRSKAGLDTVPEVSQPTDDAGNTSDTKIYSDDTKDILRMVLVLGCQPGFNYIRSTLEESSKTTSF